MSRKTQILSGLALALAVASVVYVWFSPLARFTRKISQADRAVVKMHPSSPVSVTITGEDLRRVVEMVSSGGRDRKQYDCTPVSNVKFFRGDEVVGQMTTCLQLMWIGGRQYRDHTGQLESLVVRPLLEATRGSPVPTSVTK